MKRRLFNAITLLSVLLMLLSAGMFWRSTQFATDMLSHAAGERSVHLWVIDGWLVLGVGRAQLFESPWSYERDAARPNGIYEVVGEPQFHWRFAYEFTPRSSIICFHLSQLAVAFGILPVVRFYRKAKREGRFGFRSNGHVPDRPA